MNTSTAGTFTFRLTGHFDGEAQLFFLEAGDNAIGSHSDNQIRLDAPQISRRHAVVTIDGDSARLTDLKSKNGTFVNGVKVRTKRLSNNDWLQVGPVVLTFEVLSAEERQLGIATEVEADSSMEAFGEELHDTPHSTELGLGDGDRDSWVEALNCCSSLLLGMRNPDIGAALAALADADDAATFVFLRWDGSKPLTVEACAGEPDCLGELTDPSIISALHPGHGCEPHIHAYSLSLDRPAYAAIHWTSRGWSAALVVCGVRIPSSLRPVLETALRLLISVGSQDLQAPSSTIQGSLSMPSWHVVSRSGTMQNLYDQLKSLSRSGMPILVTGETGVGKEHIVRILHDSSNRSGGPLQIVNCTAIPKDLLEAEVFGIEKGVATGVSRRDGKMRLADGGSLFLDEIGDMDPALQGKLLRALQEREVHPIGAPEPIPVDVRIIAATHADLAKRVREGGFREDLYYRIAGCEVHVPALRDRRDDIPALVRHFLERALDDNGKELRGLSVKALEVLVNALWPGNVRQLQHEVERLVALCPSGHTIESTMISPAVLNNDLGLENGSASDLNLKRRLSALERELVLKAIERSDGNHSEAARLLGVTRNGLTMKMGRLKIEK